MKPNTLTPTMSTWCPPSPEYGRGELGNPRLAALRAAKAALLPRAAALAGEGRSYQEIAATLGIAKSTVCNWLRDRPLGRAAARSLGTPRMTARLAARYESMYHRALREWNRSRTDRRTESVETILPADGSPTTKTTVRTEPRIGNAACLGKALAATQALEGLHRRERTRREWSTATRREGRPRRGQLHVTRRRMRPRTWRPARQFAPRAMPSRKNSRDCLCRDSIAPAFAVQQRCRTNRCKRGGVGRPEGRGQIASRAPRPATARKNHDSRVRRVVEAMALGQWGEAQRMLRLQGHGSFGL